MSQQPPAKARFREISKDDASAVVDLLAEGFPARSRAYWEHAVALLEDHPTPAGYPRLYTDQSYVEDANGGAALDVTDPKAVLGYVLGSLPPTVKVYPTENYYYFYFYHGGIKWAGNLRFDVETRDSGKVHMTYFKDFTAWQQDESDYTRIWSAADGVTIGPILLGCAKPVHILTPTASVRRIVNMTALSVVDCSVQG